MSFLFSLCSLCNSHSLLFFFSESYMYYYVQAVVLLVDKVYLIRAPVRPRTPELRPKDLIDPRKLLCVLFLATCPLLSRFSTQQL